MRKHPATTIHSERKSAQTQYELRLCSMFVCSYFQFRKFTIEFSVATVYVRMTQYAFAAHFVFFSLKYLNNGKMGEGERKKHECVCVCIYMCVWEYYLLTVYRHSLHAY